MRSALLLGALIIGLWPSRAVACREVSYVEEEARTLPSRPTIHVHIARRDGRLPTFARPDGTLVPYRIKIDFGDPSTMAVDLDIDHGVLVVRPGTGPTRTFEIDPFMTPHTRSIYTLDHAPDGTRWHHQWFEVDSDAEWFRVDDADGSHYEIVTAGNRVPGDFTTHDRPARITALYPDGTEELIYDFHFDEEPSSPWAALALAGIAAAFTKIRRFPSSLT